MKVWMPLFFERDQPTYKNYDKIRFAGESQASHLISRFSALNLKTHISYLISIP